MTGLYSDYLGFTTPYIPPKEKLREESLQTHKASSFQVGDYYPIPFSEESRIRILSFLERDRTFPYETYEAESLTPEELTNLNYILLSLEAFFTQKNKYHTSKKEILSYIVNPDGAKILKRMRLKSFLESNQSCLISKPDWWDTTVSKPIEDIGEVFNYNYAMYWEAPDEQDYLMSQLPVDIDEEQVAKFTDMVNEIVESCSDFEFVEREEILLRVSSSKALSPCGKSIPHYSEKHNHLYFSSIRKEGKRVLITTGPGQGRDAILNTIEDLNTIQFINENVRCFLEKNFRQYLLLGNAEKSKLKYFRTAKKSNFFYCRDIKKEGITKPKYLLKIFLSALHKRYPDCEAFQYTDFYSGPWFEGDKGQRGHGLGMANELTTFMQIMLYFFTNRILGEEGSYIVSSKGLFLNDDAVIFFSEDLESNEDFIDTDFSVCDSLGIIAQKDKSFFSKNACVFCELYYSKLTPFANEKESYFLRELKIILRCKNILEVKFLLGNMKGSLSQVEEMLKIAYTKFGYEFSEKELDWPISMGGFRPMKLRGTDFSFLFIEKEKSLGTVYRAYKANLNRRLWNFNKFIKNYQSPILSLYPSLALEDPEILAKLGLGSDYDLACSFFRPTKERKFHTSINKLFKERRKIFDETPHKITKEEFTRQYVQNSLSNVYLEPQFIEKEIEVFFFTLKDFKDPYTVKNPLYSYLNYKNLVNDESKPKTDWGLYNTNANLLHEKSVFARARTFNTLSLIDRFEEDLEVEVLIFPKRKEDIEIFMESYPKPFLASELVREGNKLPIPKEDFRNPVLKKRRTVYRGYLQYYHIILSQTIEWEMIMNILWFEWMFPFDYDLEFWVSVLDNIEASKEIPDIPNGSFGSSSSEDSDSEDFPDLDSVLVDFSSVKITEDKEDEVIIEPDLKSDSDIEIEVENKPKNIFLLSSGPLPDGDISVYGSEEWIKWYVRQHPIDLEEYYQNDEDLESASVDMFNHYRRKLAVSDIITIDEQVANLVLEAKITYISKYYLEYINEGSDEEATVFGDDFDADDF